MNFFKYFPVLSNENKQILRNLTHKVVIRKNLIKQVELYYDYVLTDNDRIDELAAKYYGDEKYWWVILIANPNILDSRYDIPMNYSEFIAFIAQKYGSLSNASTTIHHYELSDGTVVDESEPERIEVSNYDFEDRLNESKRTIKLIRKDYLELIKEEFKSTIKKLQQIS